MRKIQKYSLISTVAFCIAVLGCLLTYRSDSSVKGQNLDGFTFDCDNSPENPCRTLVLTEGEGEIFIEASGVAWLQEYNRAIVVSDNLNDLLTINAGHYAIASFSLDGDSSEIPIEPLLTPQQVNDFPLYDLEGVTFAGDILYAIGSLALHGKNPDRDRWERHQFVRMEIVESEGILQANNLAHVTERWPDFRSWLISKSEYPWTGEETRGRAEGDGINVEALSANEAGNIAIGLRGPLLPDGNGLALELSLPDSADGDPVLVNQHSIPPVDIEGVESDTPKTLRGMTEVPEHPGEFYILLGPKGYEKEPVVLARWNSNNGELSKATPLPAGFVAEGVVPIAENRLLLVDDLKGAIVIATEN